MDFEKENGAMVIEAAFVYPIMFFIIFFLIYMGNMFYLKSNIESCVNNLAIQGASYYADPILEQMETEGIPAVDNMDIQPYRYLNLFANGTEDIDVKEVLQKEIDNTGFFIGMTPKVVNIEAKPKIYIIYNTYVTDVEYVLQFPIRFLFQEDYYFIKGNAHAEIPIVDNAEFIRNTDMVIDYIQRSETGQKGIEKLTQLITKVGDFVNPKKEE